jgi:penicillin-binding protein 1A
MTGPARTLDRKVEEALLALRLERSHDKAEILERYLNTVYFGRGAYGVAAAAARYFGVAPEALELHEAALLAGLIASPPDSIPSIAPTSPCTDANRCSTRW